MPILVAVIGFGFGANAQQLSSSELKQLYEKYPNAVRVYQDRVLELENTIRNAEVKIEYLKTELAWNTGDAKAANSQIHRRIEEEQAKIKEAKRNLESAHRHYRGLINK